MVRVIALAGRRIDAPDSETPHFPLLAVPLVRNRLHTLFADCGAVALICSAACGADLVALEMATELGLRCRVVLPFAPERFRETSVTDRSGEWGPLYDHIIDAVREAGDLVVLEGAGEGGVAYAAANERILADALALAGTAAPTAAALAVIVWEGRSRGEDDATQQFADLARKNGLEIREILTS